jgi:hypothetical protein
MPLACAHFVPEVHHIGRKIDFLDGPRILDRVAVHLVKVGIPHRAKREIEAGI